MAAERFVGYTQVKTDNTGWARAESWGLQPVLPDLRASGAFLRYFDREGMRERITRDGRDDRHLEPVVRLMHRMWSQKEGGKSPEAYHAEILGRVENAKTPPILFEQDGQVGGVIFPLRISTAALPATFDLLTGEGLWTTDSTQGRTLVCPQIAVNPDFSKSGAARHLIESGVMTYAIRLYQKDELSKLKAYSRPGAYGEHAAHKKEGISLVNIATYLRTTYPREGTESFKQSVGAYEAYWQEKGGAQSDGLEGLGAFLRERNRRHIDPTIGMHLSFGARIEKILPNGCPQDEAAGGYIVVMDYTPVLVELGRKP